MTTPESNKSVFISYSHKDHKWLIELQKFLSPWIREQKLNLWDDTQIRIGSNWQSDIKSAINSAKVAVLLVSQDFFASKFIMDYELPLLIERAQKNEIRLIWIAIGFSTYKQTILSEYQAANDPNKPISKLPKPQRDKTLVQIANSIADALTIGSFAKSFKIIDKTTESIEAFLENRQERKDRVFGVQAKYEAEKDVISFRGSEEVISFKDLEKLPKEDREFISDYEESLERNYNRWSKLRKGLGEAGGALDDEIQNQLNRVVKLICDDLNNILDFLGKMHKYQLDDHYGRYRYLCSQLKDR